MKKRAFFAPRFKLFHVRIDHNGSRASQPMARGTTRANCNLALDDDGSHRPLLLNEVAVTPSSTPRIEWPCARLAALPGRWVQKCCRGSGYPVFWHRAIRRVAVALSTLHRSEQRSGDGKVGHCANLLIPHLRGNKPVLVALLWHRE